MAKFRWHPVDDSDHPDGRWECITKPEGTVIPPFHWRITDGAGVWPLVLGVRIPVMAEVRLFWLPMTIYKSEEQAKHYASKMLNFMRHEPVAKGLANLMAQFQERTGG